MLKLLRKSDFDGMCNEAKVRKLITACTQLNLCLLLIRAKDSFVKYVYETRINVYADKFERKRAFDELFNVYCDYLDRSRPLNEPSRLHEYEFFIDHLVQWDNLSKRQKELLTKIGNDILYGNR